MSVKKEGWNGLNLKFSRLYINSKDRDYFGRINDEAFPPSERMEFDKIFAFAVDTDTDVLGIYDESRPIGFAVLLKNKECDYIYFFAIDGWTRPMTR